MDGGGGDDDALAFEPLLSLSKLLSRPPACNAKLGLRLTFPGARDVSQCY